MKTLPSLVVVAIALSVAGCGKKKPAPAPTEPPPAAPTAPATSSTSLGGAPKRTIDDAKARLDAAQKREAQGAEGVR